MQAFADLLERLMLTPSRGGKRALIAAYFRGASSPDRGFALAILADALNLPRIKPAAIRDLIEARMDAELFRLSYANGRDLAETIALVWPGDARRNRTVPVADFVAELEPLAPDGRAKKVAEWLDGLDATGRWAVLKLVMGGMKVDLSPRLAREAVAELGGVEVSEVETVWHGLTPPYDGLFEWLDGAGPRPFPGHDAPFRALAPMEEIVELDAVTPEAVSAEQATTGQRVLLVCEGTMRRLYSAEGDDISHLFPDVLAAAEFEGAVDGILCVGGHAAGGGLTKRLTRKRVSKALMAEMPAFICAYDALQVNDEDVRALPYDMRRDALEGILSGLCGPQIYVSSAVEFETVSGLDDARNAPDAAGVMLKRRDAVYGACDGWHIWRRDPHTIKAALIYVERGTGRQSNAYALATFAVWSNVDGDEILVPVGKTALELDTTTAARVDGYVRANTVERFGPVRSVKADTDQGLVFELAFDGVEPAARRKSGLNLRGMRAARLCEGKRPDQAGRIETLEAMLPGA